MPSTSAATRSLNLLPEDFCPNVTHVIIGRGKKHSKHSGNLRYSTLVHEEMHAYAAAENKAGKSEVISRLVARVRETGNFVREAGQGRWALVEEHAVRTTTAQHFRDALYSKYRSSKEMKKQKRKEDRKVDGSVVKSGPEAHQEAADAIQEPSKKRARCVSPESSLTQSLTNLTASASSAPGFFQKQFQMPQLLQAQAGAAALAQVQAAQAPQPDAMSVFSSAMFMNKVNFQDSNPFEPTPMKQQQDAPGIFGAFAETLNFPAAPSNPFDALHDMPFFHEVDANNAPRFAI